VIHGFVAICLHNNVFLHEYHNFQLNLFGRFNNLKTDLFSQLRTKQRELKGLNCINWPI